MLEYFPALWVHWVALMTGIVSLLLSSGVRIIRWSVHQRGEPSRLINPSVPAILSQRSMRKKISEFPAWVLVVVGITGLFWAGFQTWRDEHLALKSAQKTLEELSSPKLVGSIEQTVIGESSDPALRGKTMVLFWMRIMNLGADSIASSYRLKVYLTDGKVFHTDIPERIQKTLRFQTGQILKDTTGTAIYEKTSEAPIVRGSAKFGLLQFVVWGESSREFQKPGTRYSVDFADVNGKIYTAEHVLTTSGQGQFLSFPGTPLVEK